MDTVIIVIICAIGIGLFIIGLVWDHLGDSEETEKMSEKEKKEKLKETSKRNREENQKG